MSSTQARRFQFTILDMLAVTALTFLSLCAVTPFVSLVHGGRRGEVTIGCALAVIAAVLAGAAAGAGSASQKRETGGARTARILFGGAAGCLAFTFFAAMTGSLLTRPRCGNQCAAAACCKAYAEAQEIYHRTDWDGDDVLEYATALSGNNSLLEKTAGSGDIALVDRTFAFAEGRPGQVPPKAGYVFKVLTRQGPNAVGGRKSYFAWDAERKQFSPHMTLGYALVATPAQYNGTGRDTFIISNQGIIYQCDLGPNTATFVNCMREFDPDPKKGWVPAE